jgi:hypothetical protein
LKIDALCEPSNSAKVFFVSPESSAAWPSESLPCS